MIFLTVGTQFPFDRLVAAVDEYVEKNKHSEEIYAQIGDSSYSPKHIRAVQSMNKSEYDETFRRASCVISHAGMGTISMALEYSKPLLVLPRLKKYGEVVNDHQVDIAEKFEAIGHLLVAYEGGMVSDGIRKLKNFIPRKRQSCPHKVSERIRCFLDDFGKV